jgi:hypothetical protein
MNVQEINRAIITGNLNNTELSSIIDAIKFARARLTDQTKRSLTLGSKVKFTSNRNGQTYTGTVEKIAIKFVTVRENKSGSFTSGLWKVPANMLEVVA